LRHQFLFEPIQAENNTVNCQINTKKSSIVFVVSVKEFRFDKSLMQQHFKKNYLESNKYPRAIFKGQIEQFKPNSKPLSLLLI
jgi:hypothetical protein